MSRNLSPIEEVVLYVAVVLTTLLIIEGLTSISGLFYPHIR